MSSNNEQFSLQQLEESISCKKGISVESLRKMLSKVAEYGESHRAHGLPDELQAILEEDLSSKKTD